MKKLFLNIFFIFVLIFFTGIKSEAVEFDLVVLPVNLFSVCDNYFCFPEVSNLIADDVITNLGQYKGINTKSLAQVREALFNNSQMKQKTQTLLNSYGKDDKIDFQTLDEVAKFFNVKSVLLINSYSINDKTDLRRSLWEVLEISSAFKVTYPFELKTSAVLTDCVNNLVMWSGKYTKNVSDSFGYYSASNQTQALSQLEKIKQYQKISARMYLCAFSQEKSGHLL